MPHLTLEEFSDRVTDAMQVISREFLKQQTEEFYDIKLTVPQFVVLDLIQKVDEPKMTPLARTLNVTTAAMTGIVDRLVRDNYVERISDLDDRRIIKLKLRPKGTKIVRKIADHRKRSMMKIFGMISQSERDEYLKILMHIQKHLKEEK